MSDRDASDSSATSCACRARGIWRTTRHTDRRAALYTPQQTAGRPNRYARGKLNGEVAREDVGRVTRMLYEVVTRKLLPWNFGYTFPFFPPIQPPALHAQQAVAAAAAVSLLRGRSVRGIAFQPSPVHSTPRTHSDGRGTAV